MRDQRADALARFLVRYSTRVEKGNVCAIQSTTVAEPLVQAVYEEVLRAGGLPVIQLTTEGATSAFYELASEQQLDVVPPTSIWAAENADVRIAVMADANARELTAADLERQARHSRARKPLMETSMLRAAAPVRRGQPPGRLNPGPRGGPDHRPRWHRRHAQRLRPHLRPLRRRAQHARQRVLHRSGRGLGHRRDSLLVPGRIRRPRGVGRAAALRGGARRRRLSRPAEDFLLETLDTDGGARRLGELGIGTHYGITTATTEVLLDEKIGGTVHMAVGMSYPETGGRNDSAVHWDIVWDLREGGRITVDGMELQRDGRFVV